MLLFDGEPMLSLEDYSVEWHQLMPALIEPGQYLLFTCTCGDADCGGIGQRNVVTHHDTFVRWEMRQPAPRPVLEFDRAEAPRPVLEFDRAEAMRQTFELLEEIRSFVPPADYGTDFPVLPVSLRDCSLEGRISQFGQPGVAGVI